MRSSPLRLIGNEEQPLHELPLRQPQMGFTKSAANILETLLGVFDKRPPRLFSSIDAGGVQTAIDVSSALSEKPERSRDIVFRTVFGATQDMPVGALSYLLPSLRMAEALTAIEVNRSARLPESIFSPRIEFVQMNEAGVRINGLDSQTVREQSSLFRDVASAYIEKFHPTLSSRVTFGNDDRITPELLTSAKFRFTRMAAILVSGVESLRLFMMARHHGNGSGFFTYAALHPFLHDVATDPRISTLVSFGAKTEEVFYKVRRRLRPVLRFDKTRRLLPTAQYITSHHTPPYHMLSGGDISLNTALDHPDSIVNPDVHSPVRKSLDQLFTDVGGISIFHDFLKSLERR